MDALVVRVVEVGDAFLNSLQECCLDVSGPQDPSLLLAHEGLSCWGRAVTVTTSDGDDSAYGFQFAMGLILVPVCCPALDDPLGHPGISHDLAGELWFHFSHAVPAPLLGPP